MPIANNIYMHMHSENLQRINPMVSVLTIHKMCDGFKEVFLSPNTMSFLH